MSNSNGKFYGTKAIVYENTITTKNTTSIKESAIRNGVFHIIKIQLELRCNSVVPDGNISDKILLQNGSFLPSIEHLPLKWWISKISGVDIERKALIKNESTFIKDKIQALHEQ